MVEDGEFQQRVEPPAMGWKRAFAIQTNGTRARALEAFGPRRASDVQWAAARGTCGFHLPHHATKRELETVHGPLLRFEAGGRKLGPSAAEWGLCNL